MPPIPTTWVNPDTGWGLRADGALLDQLPVRIFTDGMTSCLQGCCNHCVRMGLKQCVGIFGNGIAEEGDSQCCLLPSAGITVYADFAGGETFTEPESYRHGRHKLISGATAPVG